MRGLSHIGIIVKDAYKSAEFYREAFGFEMIEDFENSGKNPASRLVFVKKDAMVIEFIQARPEHPGIMSRVGHIAHFCVETDDLESQIEKMKKILNQPDLKTPDFSPRSVFDGCRGVFINGPDGESIEINQYL